jgi:glycosyltransferase involved in cell wall biosynthesis
MSKFGQDAMPGSELIYHGVDPVFEPMNKTQAKRALGYDPDRFLVLRTDKNSTRKNYADSWRAMAPLLRKYRDIDVHFHCLPVTSDFNIKAFISRDEDIRDRVNFSTDIGGFTGWSVESLRMLYSAADLFISTSMGEGFGLTIAEALACGTPVVASGVSAITEVVGPGGVTVPAVRPFAAPMGQDQMLPDVEGITQAVERLYHDRKTRRDLGEAGRAHVLAHFSWDSATASFDRVLREVAAGFSPVSIQTSIRSTSDGRVPEGSPA